MLGAPLASVFALVSTISLAAAQGSRPAAQKPTLLDTARTVAEEDKLRQAYYIKGDEIGTSRVATATARDVVEHLRPKMIIGRSGIPGVAGSGGCGRMQAVIVNNVLIEQPPVGSSISAASTTPQAIMGMVNSRPARALSSKQLNFYVTGVPAAVLTSIKAEHIEDMTYHDCFDPPIPGAPGVRSALFVRLKPGYAYADTVGSYKLP